MNCKSIINHQSKRGFTLIELLVSVVILGVLISLILFTLNPIYQYSKAFDGQRKQDLNQIRSALDTYYNDHNCYPNLESQSELSIPFGQEWSEGDTIYMKKVPQDPSPYVKAGLQYGYNYETDAGEDSCPQWNILFAKLTDKAYSDPSDSRNCATQIRKICPDARVSLTYNFCLISGDPDCEVLTNTSPPGGYVPAEPTPTLPPGTPTIVPTSTPGPTPTPTPSLLCPIGTNRTINYCYMTHGTQNPCTHLVEGICNDGYPDGNFCDSACSIYPSL